MTLGNKLDALLLEAALVSNVGANPANPNRVSRGTGGRGSRQTAPPGIFAPARDQPLGESLAALSEAFLGYLKAELGDDARERDKALVQLLEPLYPGQVGRGRPTEGEAQRILDLTGEPTVVALICGGTSERVKQVRRSHEHNPNDGTRASQLI